MDDNAADILGLSSNRREIFLQTAIREDDVFDESDEELALSSLKNITPHKPALRKPQAGVLMGKTFLPPNPDSLARASRFRAASLTPLATPRTAEDGAPLISNRRYDVRRIKRKRKLRQACAAGRAEGPCQVEQQGRPNEDGADQDSDEYDFDSNDEDEDEHARSVAAPPEILSQSVYRTTCKSLGIFLSARVLRSLPSRACVVKHQILLPVGVKACAIALLSNPFVTKLHFEENEMGEEGAQYMADLLVENIGITDLTISENKIGRNGLISLTKGMKANNRLKRLDLSGNGFEEKDADIIADIIEENDALDELILSHNNFREAGGVVIAGALRDTLSLRVLDLSWNHLRRRGVVAISTAMAVNRSLEVLDLSWNGVATEGCEALGCALKQNRSLRDLDLSSGRISVLGLGELLKGLKENTTLEILRLDNNSLSMAGSVAILNVLKECPNLPIKELDIGSQCVDENFASLLIEVKAERDLLVHHGPVISRDTSEEADDNSVEKEDPMMVLMECMRLKNLRLVDLFSSLDKNGSKSLEHHEFKSGLLAIKIPMTPGQIDKLIDQLDADGDGEVDYKELVIGQKDYNKKVHKMKQRQLDVPLKETEIGRIRMKLLALISCKTPSEPKQVESMVGKMAKLSTNASPEDETSQGKGGKTPLRRRASQVVLPAIPKTDAETEKASTARRKSSVTSRPR